MNELIFISYIALVSIAILIATRMGKEALVALICVQWVLTNLFVTKQISLLGFNATASDALAVGASLSLNILQEYHGKKIAHKAIIIGLCATIFYTAVSLLQILYCPSALDYAHDHFCALLTPMPRITATSLIVYYITQQFDYRLYGLLKSRFNRIPMALRNGISVGLTQGIDTILFSFLGLYGIVANISEIIIVSYSIKIAIVICSAPFIAFSKYLYKNDV